MTSAKIIKFLEEYNQSNRRRRRIEVGAIFRSANSGIRPIEKNDQF
jgi:hypothetical protein